MNVRPSPDDFGSTLVDLLRKRAVGRCAERGFTFFRGDDSEDFWLRYRDLDRAAQQIAMRLLAANPVIHPVLPKPEDLKKRTTAGLAASEDSVPRAVILCPPGPEYLKALFGVMYAGMIAVTAYPPRARRRDQRLDRVIKDSGATIALTDATLFERREQLARVSPALERLEWIAVEQDVSTDSLTDLDTRAGWRPPSISTSDIAMLQYTSGSTSHPKGVCLTHGNLIANLGMIYELFSVEHHDDQWCVTWLPPYHDMGLIGGLFQVMYAGVSSHVMPPAAFVQKPVRWLRAITKYGATVSGGPNFAFDTCVDRIPISERDSLDLSSWSLAFTGAEPIRDRTLQRFVDTFASVGFRPQAFFPCYGLAEATLIVSGGPRESRWKADFRPIQSSLNSVDDSSNASSASVSCGVVASALDVRIVDPESYQERDCGQVGEVWVAGPSVSPGYWRHEESTNADFQHSLQGHAGKYLRTGDVGYFKDGELFLCGRLKELIVVRGRNFHPADIESELADCHELLDANSAAAIEVEGDEGIGLAIVQELERDVSLERSEQVVQAIRRRIVSRFDLQPDRIILIPKRSLPRTSSGKVQRLAVRAAAATDTLHELPGSYRRPKPQQAMESVEPKAITDSLNAASAMVGRSEEQNAPSADRKLYKDEIQCPGKSRSRTEISDWLVNRIAKQLEVSRQEIDIHRPFIQFGLDSVSAVQIAGELEAFVDRSIPATLFYEAPHIAAVSDKVAISGPQTAGSGDEATDCNVNDHVARQSYDQASCSTANHVKQDAAEDAAIADLGSCGESVHAATTKEAMVAEETVAEEIPKQHVAIIGVACRFPGCDTPEAFWQLLRDGRSTVCEPPANRRECVGQDAITNRAGWLEDPSLFDAALFGISPREAGLIDPQHRLLLETSWRAVEDASLDPRRLAGGNVGVFVGISNRDYERLLSSQDWERSTYAMTGNAASMAAHRVSYHFDLQGPSLAVDTACSSSLVALHQAIRALHASDCEMAIVGGVNLILSPEVTETLTDAEMLSVDGVCKAFDAAADGYGRGEGCVAVVLKPLRKAVADGDPVRAVIRGGAINQDGATNGITAPNGDSQERLYRTALSNAGLSASDVSHVETHGTGTPLGDPIEFGSLQAVYGNSSPSQEARQRPDTVISAVKANLGHLEAAAGLAGLLRVVLELQHRTLTPQPYFHELNPHIDASDSTLRVPTKLSPWDSKIRVAAVSSFGFGGTNAHVILGEHACVQNERNVDRQVPGEACLVALSGLDETSLDETVEDHLSCLQRESILDLDDFAAATQHRKTSHRHRLAVVGDSIPAVRNALRESHLGDKRVWRGVAPADRNVSIAFLFSGQGGQHVGMGQGLYQRDRQFREEVDHCDQLLREEFGYGITPLIASDPGTNGPVAKILEGPGAQTGLFTLQRALSVTFQRWGVDSDIVLGHSMGEYAAAALAGVLSWDDALRLTASRADAVERLKDRGSMSVIFDSLASVQHKMNQVSHDLSVAAIDGPEHVVVSGPHLAMEELNRRCRQAGTAVRPLRITQAFHSRLIEPALDSIVQTLRHCERKPPTVRYVSAVTGELVSSELQSVEYWSRHSREPVQFVSALKTLSDLDCDVALEIGPHSTLCALGQLNSDVPMEYRPTLLRQRGGWDTTLEAIADLYCRGVEIDWREFSSGRNGKHIRLPGHPLHSKRHWFISADSDAADSVSTRKVVENLKSSEEPPRPSNGVLAPQDELRLYADAMSRLDGLAAKYICLAFVNLGWVPAHSAIVDLDQLEQQGAIASRHRRLVHRLCQILEEDGMLESVADGEADSSCGRQSGRSWTVTRRFPFHLGDLASEVRELERAHTVVRYELQLLARCGEALSSVLRGKQDPLSVLFANGDSSDLEKLYRASPISKSSNRLLTRVASIIQGLRSTSVKGLKVLEVGGGTGGATSALLPGLVGGPFEYCFTDASPLLVAESTERFADADMDCRVLDIESDPSEQGFAGEQFDLIVAANVLHATKQLSGTLANLRSLLSPGGVLLALEGVRKERFLDLVFGLTEGWWHFSDTEVRSDYPLLNESQWTDLLRQAGFVDVSGLPFPAGEESVRNSQAIWMAVQDTNAGVNEPASTNESTRVSAASSGSARRTAKDELAKQATQSWVDAFHAAGKTAEESPETDADQRRMALEGYFRESIAAVLGHSASELDLHQPVSNLGIDSLMAIQMKNRLERDLNLSVPMIAFLQGKSIAQLIDVALAQEAETAADATHHAQPLTDSLPDEDTTSADRFVTKTTELSTTTKAPARHDDVSDERFSKESKVDWTVDDSLSDHSDHAVLNDVVSNRTSVLHSRSDHASGRSDESPALEAKPARRERVLGPMSVGQLALWMIHQRAPSGPAYNFAFAARTSGMIDKSALLQACRSLVKRHPVLRTHYRLNDDGPVRVLSPTIDVTMTEIDCRDWKESRLRQWIREQADQPFDLQDGPVIRYELLRRRQGDVLSIAMHHIAADLWSMDVLIQELIDLYAMIVGGGAIELGPLPTTYDAYVRWEQELNESAEGQRLWDFWREKLDGAPHVLNLPTTYTRPAEQTFQGDSFEWTLSAEVVDSLREIAQSERTTMFTIVLAAYQVFLSRVCNQDDLLVGTVSASRGRSDWEGIVGYFLNQLVLRTRINGAPSFRDVLRDSQREVLDALEHQSYPFAKLVERIRPDRDASRSPLIQTMFIWDKPRHLKESHFSPGKSSDRLRLNPLLMEQRGAPFDLTLIVFEMEDELRFTFRYNTDLFSPDAIATLSSSFETFIEAVARDPDASVRTRPMLTSDQEDQLEAWNHSEMSFDPQLSGDAVFRQWAKRTPSAIAIETTSEALTYEQVNDCANRVAFALRRKGLRSGQMVAIVMERSLESFVATLGIWRAGGAYVPIDPEHPEPRRQAILEDATPRFVLFGKGASTQKETRVNFNCVVMDYDEALAALPTEADVRHFPAVDPDRPAYMIYTSGSTGKPKGVVIPHRGLANLIAAQRQTFGIRSEDRCLQFASLTFDASVFETMMAFHAGATLFVMETSVRRTTASGIASAIRERGVTVATLPPSVLSAIPAENLPSLRLLVSAGEACSASLVAKWKPGRQMFNAYGPTEATVWAATQRCRDDGQDPNLGRPIGNVGAYVVDERCELVPVGVAGELCLSGPGLAIEYHRRPDKTAEAFLPNPFDQRFDATLYRTGDRVRWNEEGNLEFLGRLDEQVKIGGHRIEPGEIASTIRNMPEVQDSCVSVRGDGAGRTLIAYVVPSIQDGIESVEPTAVRNYVKERLPTYMHPQSVVLIDQIPWNANGKVDYDRLPTGAPIVPQKSRMDHPLTKTEQDLAAIWKEVLQLESLSVDDNFFDLGGASLQALQAADLASQRGLDFSAERMFQYQTIAELASEIDSCAASQSSIDGTLTGGDGQTTLASETEWTPASALGSDPPDIIANEESVDPFDRSASRNELRMVVESIGMYLPEATSLTSDIVAACERPLDFPLERMTGIQSRHTGNGTEFSIDLARKAAFDCLQRSRFEAEEIDLLIAANISRYDGPDFQVSYEPSTASKLKQLIGATHAVAFDVCNACAGFFTALAIAETRLLTGEARRAMVVSGEYITHLSETAQREIDGFLDPRLACLTLGDAGAAVIVELADDGSGFETLDLYTAGKHHNLCVAKATDRPHGGAIMLTDAIKASAVTLDHSVDHAHKVMKQQDWDPESVQHLIMHQTSSTTLDGAVEELNRHFGKPICGPHNTVNNLRNRGNTATTTHWVAVMDLIREGRIQPGDKTVFAISGSGQTIGTALYRFDEMPNRMRTELALPTGRSLSMRREMEVQPTASFGVRIKAVGLQKESDRSTDASPFRVVETASAAASRCLHESQWEAGDVEWLVHCGVYRDEFLSEPAVAAILAGELKMNDDRPVESGARTLAFDVSDGARGPLTACALISDQIRSGMIQRGMVTSSEIENNPSSISQRGLLEMGSAIALERCEKGYGLGAFWFASFPQYAGAVSAATQMHDGKPRLVIETNEHVAQQFTACVVATAKQYLATVEREISDYSRILCAIPPSVDAGEVAARLRVSRHVLRVPVPHSKQDGVGTLDAFTAGLAVLWEECRQEAVADERWLLLAMGAGVEVACAEYRHEGSGSLEDA